jgi:hypothetical protein
VAVLERNVIDACPPDAMPIAAYACMISGNTYQCFNPPMRSRWSPFWAHAETIHAATIDGERIPYCLDLLPPPNNGFPSLHRPV